LGARLTTLLLLLPPLALTGPAGAAFAAEEKVLNVYNWADYIGPTTIEDFEAEYGIEVNYDLYDATAVVEAKLLAGRTGYDVVLQALRYSSRLIEAGAFQPLDRDRLNLWENLDPWVLGMMAEYDPGNRYATPYMWGTTGFAYNVRMVRERMPDAPLDSAALVFDPAIASRFADCGISLLDESTTVLPLVMLYLGYPAQSIDPEHLAEAEAVLKSVRPYIRYFSSARLINDLPNGEVCIAMSWSGDYAQAQLRAEEEGIDIELAYRVPREGTTIFLDSLLIPADAPHPGNAHLFLNYLMRPAVIASISDLLRYANANLASLPLLDPALRDDPAAYPPMEDRRNWRAGHIYDPKLERRRTRAWSRVKTGL
jgi:putrescine transport system substrate-binding protein